MEIDTNTAALLCSARALRKKQTTPCYLENRHDCMQAPVLILTEPWTPFCSASSILIEAGLHPRRPRKEHSSYLLAKQAIGNYSRSLLLYYDSGLYCDNYKTRGDDDEAGPQRTSSTHFPHDRHHHALQLYRCGPS